MSRPLGVVEYASRWEEPHRAFARRMWPDKRRRSDPAYVRWKFRSTGAGPVEGLLLAVDGEEVLGQLGLLPATLVGPGGHLDGCWACDLMVDPAARGRGIATALFGAALDRDRYIVGSDPSPGADAVMTRFGFHPAPGPWRMLFPLRPVDVARMAAGSRPGVRGRVTAHLLPIALGLWTAVTPRRRSVPAGGGDWRQAAAVLARHSPAAESWAVLHDAEFAAWRFAAPPPFDRTVSGFVDGDRAAALVEADGTSASLVDWRAPSRGAASRVVGPAVDAAARAGGTMVRAYAQDPSERRRLVSLGFVPRRSRVRILVDPRIDRTAAARSWRYTYCDSDENI